VKRGRITEGKKQKTYVEKPQHTQTSLGTLEFIVGTFEKCYSLKRSFQEENTLRVGRPIKINRREPRKRKGIALPRKVKGLGRYA